VTTIAYDGRMIASDTQTTLDNSAKLLGSKISIYSGNVMVWFSGTCTYEKEFCHYIMTGKNPELPVNEEGEDPLTECAALMLDKHNTVWFFDGIGLKLELLEPWAIGAGSAYAKAAMYLGCDAEEAVKVAARYECNTNDLVETYNIQTKRRFNPLEELKRKLPISQAIKNSQGRVSASDLLKKL
jgi:ATP-dependent protease HslVU (ClpYQ) peptidase subunit